MWMGCLVLGLFDPPLEDVRKFPDYWLCCIQATKCEEHRARLKKLRALRGYQDGVWDRALEETESLIKYWTAVKVVHDAPGPFWTRRALQSLKELVGPERYMEGWKPVLMPDSNKFCGLPLEQMDKANDNP